MGNLTGWIQAALSAISLAGIWAAFKWLLPKAIEIGTGRSLEKLKANLELENSRPVEERRQFAQKRVDALQEIATETKAIIGDALYPVSSGANVGEAVKVVSDFLGRIRGHELLLTREESSRLAQFGDLLFAAQRELNGGADPVPVFGRLEVQRQELLDFFRKPFGLA